MTDPRMLRASLAAALLQVVTPEPGARKYFPSPPQRFPTRPHQNPSPGQRNPSWTQRNQNDFSFRDSRLFKGLRRCFAPFSLRRVVDPAFGPRPADGHSHSTYSVSRKENAAQEFFRKVRASRSKTAGMAQPGFWFRIKSFARVFSERRKLPANQNGRRDV
jgi:hypothetical protein